MASGTKVSGLKELYEWWGECLKLKGRMEEEQVYAEISCFSSECVKIHLRHLRSDFKWIYGLE